MRSRWTVARLPSFALVLCSALCLGSQTGAAATDDSPRPKTDGFAQFTSSELARNRRYLDAIDSLIESEDAPAAHLLRTRLALVSAREHLSEAEKEVAEWRGSRGSETRFEREDARLALLALQDECALVEEMLGEDLAAWLAEHDAQPRNRNQIGQ